MTLTRTPTKPCKHCESLRHFPFQCPTQRKPIATRTPLKTTKPMKKIGKVGKATMDYVAAWKLTQKPNHQGMYQCYIGGDLTPYLVAEHPYSKARHPDMRTNQRLEPVCNPHNKLKGSMDISDFLEKYPEFKQTVKKEYLKEQS